MKPSFDMIPNDKTLDLEAHLSAVLFKHSICYPVARIIEHPRTSHISKSTYRYLEIVGNFRQNIKIWHIPLDSIVDI